jgi:cell division protein FtsB
MSQWLEHTLDRSRFRPQRQALALATLGLFVAIIMGALYLSQSSTTAALGRQLEEIVTRRNELEQENEQLRAEIASLESMPRLEARAQELGFVFASPDDIEYLVVRGYNPDAQAAVVPLQSNSPSVPTYDESFTGWLQQQIDSLRGQLEGFSGSSSGDASPTETSGQETQ